MKGEIILTQLQINLCRLSLGEILDIEVGFYTKSPWKTVAVKQDDTFYIMMWTTNLSYNTNPGYYKALKEDGWEVWC
jgi:hypothetical protein